MKYNVTRNLLILLLIATAILWFIGRNSSPFIGYFAIMVAIVSALVALRNFKLTNTFNKVHAITQNYEVSTQITKVLAFLDNVNPKMPDTIVCKENIENDKELFASVNFILGFLDDLAVAVNKKLIAENLTKEIIGGFFITMVRNFKPYIDEVSEFRKRQTYENLLLLYSKWSKN